MFTCLSAGVNNSYHSLSVVPPTTNVHGQYPSTLASVPSDNNESATPTRYRLIRVPLTFTVHPSRNSGSTPPRLTYNYNILQGVAGIIQILAGSFGLYRVSQRQLHRFGYASYSLTVVPYIIMSIINVMATFCEPQYPSMFIVIYRGMPLTHTIPQESQDGSAPANTQTSTSTAPALFPLEEHVVGSVGEAYGDLSKLNAPRPRSSGTKYQLRRLGVTICGICCLVAPFVVIQLLTGFDAGQSTRSQRAWLVTWLVIGQAYGIMFFDDREDLESAIKRDILSKTKYVLSATGVLPSEREFLLSICKYFLLMREDLPLGHERAARDFTVDQTTIMKLILLGIPPMGGLVVVGQMILQDDICAVI